MLGKLAGLALVATTACAQAQEAPRNDTMKVYIDSVVESNIAFLNHFVTRVGGQEFALCLNGDIRGDTLNIRNARLPQIYFTSADSMSYKPCDQDQNYIGMIHSHPRVPPIPDICVASNVDLNRWQADDRAKVELVLCDSFIHFYFKK